MIGAGLRERGIPEELIEQALSETEDNEEELIGRLILKKVRDFDEMTYEDRQKLLAGICRRGFDPDKCIKVYNELARR